MISDERSALSVAELLLGLREAGAAREAAADCVVVGAAPGVGCSTTALLLAEAMAAIGRQVQVIESAARARSGLAAASTVELGVDESGRWLRGRRGEVIIHRRADNEPEPGCLPGKPPGTYSILDSGREPHVGAGVLVGRATEPGLRAVAEALRGRVEPAAVAIVGHPRRDTCIPAVRELAASGRLVTLPRIRSLATGGPGSQDLPRSLARAGSRLVALVEPRAGR